MRKQIPIWSDPWGFCFAYGDLFAKRIKKKEEIIDNKYTAVKTGVRKTVKNNLTILRHLSDGVGNNN